MENTIRHLKHAFSGLTIIGDKKEKQREEIVTSLNVLFDCLNPLPMATIPDDTLATLSVDLRIFNPEGLESTTFFRPLTVAELARYPKDPNSTEVIRHEQRTLPTLDNGGDFYARYSSAGYTYAAWGQEICHVLTWELCTAPRLGTVRPKKTLNDVIEWWGSQTWPVKSRYLPMFSSYNENWCPKYHSRPRKDEDPHIKIFQYHGIIGSPRQLLREELIVIVGTMCTYMNREKFRKHLIIPVMMFSFMGECHGRILLAHFDGQSQRLVVRMSKLYRLLAEDEDSLALFTRYAASVVEPSGDTKRLAE